MRPVIVLTAILSCAAVPALAQRASDISGLCGTSSPATWQGLREHFVGDWRVDHLSGYVHAGRMVIPMELPPKQRPCRSGYWARICCSTMRR